MSLVRKQVPWEKSTGDQVEGLRMTLVNNQWQRGTKRPLKYNFLYERSSMDLSFSWCTKDHYRCCRCGSVEILLVRVQYWDGGGRPSRVQPWYCYVRTVAGMCVRYIFRLQHGDSLRTTLADRKSTRLGKSEL